MDHQINIKENNLSSSVSPSSPTAKIHQIIVDDTPLIEGHFETSRQSVGGETMQKKASDLHVIQPKKFKQSISPTCIESHRSQLSNISQMENPIENSKGAAKTRRILSKEQKKTLTKNIHQTAHQMSHSKLNKDLEEKDDQFNPIQQQNRKSINEKVSKYDVTTPEMTNLKNPRLKMQNQTEEQLTEQSMTNDQDDLSESPRNTIEHQNKQNLDTMLDVRINDRVNHSVGIDADMSRTDHVFSPSGLKQTHGNIIVMANQNKDNILNLNDQFPLNDQNKVAQRYNQNKGPSVVQFSSSIFSSLQPKSSKVSLNRTQDQNNDQISPDRYSIINSKAFLNSTQREVLKRNANMKNFQGMKPFMLDRIENMDQKLVRKKFNILDRMPSSDRKNHTISGHFGGVIQGKTKRLEKTSSKKNKINEKDEPRRFEESLRIIKQTDLNESFNKFDIKKTSECVTKSQWDHASLHTQDISKVNSPNQGVDGHRGNTNAEVKLLQESAATKVLEVIVGQQFQNNTHLDLVNRITTNRNSNSTEVNEAIFKKMDNVSPMYTDGSKTSKPYNNKISGHSKMKKNVLKSNLQDVVELNADLDITMKQKTKVSQLNTEGSIKPESSQKNASPTLQQKKIDTISNLSGRTPMTAYLKGNNAFNMGNSQKVKKDNSRLNTVVGSLPEQEDIEPGQQQIGSHSGQSQLDVNNVRRICISKAQNGMQGNPATGLTERVEKRSDQIDQSVNSDVAINLQPIQYPNEIERAEFEKLNEQLFLAQMVVDSAVNQNVSFYSGNEQAVNLAHVKTISKLETVDQKKLQQVAKVYPLMYPGHMLSPQMRLQKAQHIALQKKLLNRKSEESVKNMRKSLPNKPSATKLNLTLSNQSSQKESKILTGLTNKYHSRYQVPVNLTIEESFADLNPSSPDLHKEMSPKMGLDNQSPHWRQLNMVPIETNFDQQQADDGTKYEKSPNPTQEFSAFTRESRKFQSICSSVFSNPKAHRVTKQLQAEQFKNSKQQQVCMEMGRGEAVVGMKPQNIDEIISAKEEHRESMLTNKTKHMQTKTQSKIDDKDRHTDELKNAGKLNVTILNTILQQSPQKHQKHQIMTPLSPNSFVNSQGNENLFDGGSQLSQIGLNHQFRAKFIDEKSLQGSTPNPQIQKLRPPSIGKRKRSPNTNEVVFQKEYSKSRNQTRFELKNHNTLQLKLNILPTIQVSTNRKGSARKYAPQHTQPSGAGVNKQFSQSNHGLSSFRDDKDFDKGINESLWDQKNLKYDIESPIKSNLSPKNTVLLAQSPRQLQESHKDDGDRQNPKQIIRLQKNSPTGENVSKQGQPNIDQVFNDTDSASVVQMITQGEETPPQRAAVKKPAFINSEESDTHLRLCHQSQTEKNKKVRGSHLHASFLPILPALMSRGISPRYTRQNGTNIDQRQSEAKLLKKNKNKRSKAALRSIMEQLDGSFQSVQLLKETASLQGASLAASLGDSGDESHRISQNAIEEGQESQRTIPTQIANSRVRLQSKQDQEREKTDVTKTQKLWASLGICQTPQDLDQENYRIESDMIVEGSQTSRSNLQRSPLLAKQKLEEMGKVILQSKEDESNVQFLKFPKSVKGAQKKDINKLSKSVTQNSTSNNLDKQQKTDLQKYLMEKISSEGGLESVICNSKTGSLSCLNKPQVIFANTQMSGDDEVRYKKRYKPTDNFEAYKTQIQSIYSQTYKPTNLLSLQNQTPVYSHPITPKYLQPALKLNIRKFQRNPLLNYPNIQYLQARKIDLDAFQNVNLKYSAKLNERLKSVDINGLQIQGTEPRQSQEFEIPMENGLVSEADLGNPHDRKTFPNTTQNKNNLLVLDQNNSISKMSSKNRIDGTKNKTQIQLKKVTTSYNSNKFSQMSIQEIDAYENDHNKVEQESSGANNNISLPSVMQIQGILSPTSQKGAKKQFQQDGFNKVQINKTSARKTDLNNKSINIDTQRMRRNMDTMPYKTQSPFVLTSGHGLQRQTSPDQVITLRNQNIDERGSQYKSYDPNSFDNSYARSFHLDQDNTQSVIQFNQGQDYPDKAGTVLQKTFQGPSNLQITSAKKKKYSQVQKKESDQPPLLQATKVITHVKPRLKNQTAIKHFKNSEDISPNRTQVYFAAGVGASVEGKTIS